MRIALTLDRDATEREENDYVDALLGVGFRREEIVVVPPGAPAAEDFDGVVLGGGCDVDPVLYGEAPRPDARLEIDAARDATDFALYDRARRRDVPTLAICRGMQVVNVALGGTLVQDLPTQRPGTLSHDAEAASRDARNRLDHTVRVTPGTRLADVAGAGEIPVNSRHHQAVDRLAPGLTVSATAADGVVEGLEASSPWLIAVQWHPENLAGEDGASRRLFEAFARAVRARVPAGRS